MTDMDNLAEAIALRQGIWATDVLPVLESLTALKYAVVPKENLVTLMQNLDAIQLEDGHVKLYIVGLISAIDDMIWEATND